MQDRKIVDYEIIGSDWCGIHEKVKEYMRNGWEIYGYPNIFEYETFSGNRSTSIKQAMVKYEDVAIAKTNNKDNFLDAEIKNLGLTQRTKNCLLSENIYSLRDVKKLKPPYKIVNMGAKSMMEFCFVILSEIIKHEESEK